MEQMPVISLPKSRTEQWHDWLSIAAIAGSFVYALVRWPDLPNTVPIHFNASGEPDGTGSKWTLFIITLIAILMFALLSWIRNRPEKFNFPVQVTEQNAPRLYRLTRDMLSWIKLEIALLLGYIQWSVIRSAEMHDAIGGYIPFIIVIVVILGTIFGYAFRIARNG